VTASLLLLLACAPKPSVIRGERLVTDFTQEYSAAAGASVGMTRPWLGSGQSWGFGPQAALAAERAYPGHLAWWSSLAWSSHALRDGSHTFSSESTPVMSAESLDGQQVLIWAETGIQYTPDRGWNQGQLDLRLLMRGTLAVGGVQTRLDVPAADGRARLETTDLFVAPNGHVGVQGVWAERWDLRLLVGAAPVVAFDRAELGGGDSGRVTLRTHATLETLVRF
jgi:hypothetical protein